MDSLLTTIYSRSTDLPEMSYHNFFHSKSLFEMYEQTPGQSPYMVVVSDSSHRILCHLLAVVRRRGSWMPPYLYSQCRVYGEGDYADSEWRREELFAQMLTKLTGRLRMKCLYTEFSDLSTKMFAYKYFRRCNYFPIHWMEIHNSLHSKPPEARVSDKVFRKIQRGYASGVTTTCVETDEDRAAGIRLIRQFYSSKLRRYCPPERFLRLLGNDRHGQLFVTKYKGRTIGSAACIYSNGNAYLWYLAYRKKSYPLLHPDMMSVWAAIKHAENTDCQHIFFLDVGLPFYRNRYREFILKFGGKPVSTNRWFRFNIGWLNYLFSKLYP